MHVFCYEGGREDTIVWTHWSKISTENLAMQEPTHTSAFAAHIADTSSPGRLHVLTTFQRRI